MGNISLGYVEAFLMEKEQESALDINIALRQIRVEFL